MNSHFCDPGYTSPQVPPAACALLDFLEKRHGTYSLMAVLAYRRYIFIIQIYRFLQNQLQPQTDSHRAKVEEKFISQLMLFVQ
jgi:cellulose synthase/poly-beta-1,6-N-acetylglucosamine synthase-like glycosyltransferase